eukprot:CAMPEP_0197041584 /NCGR_PEP_ID=MMETSP1384-20130603/18109_1 /TAXON_ID=29189 /ORGANISM="Ammonia sp." /LENGTH=434 /DNA_ID=CAMNT_0042472537 /DNA_START=24 /DNA_END=1328 /DNA_ORIENTATION=-
MATHFFTRLALRRVFKLAPPRIRIPLYQTQQSRRRLTTPSVPTTHGILTSDKSLQLIAGGVLPASTIKMHYATWGHKSNPTILIAPSMSNSCFVTDHPDLPQESKFHGGLWWQRLVGFGPQFAIDTQHYHVVSITPLGSPFGSTSPLSINPETDELYGASFPVITPMDQARFIRLALDELGVHDKMACIIGGSMGGMQVLEYAAQFPDTYEKMVAIATTGWTSPSTVALRSIQRKIVRLDPHYNPKGTQMGKLTAAENMLDTLQGMIITRMIGTICYRSRTEFDDRFDWHLKKNDEGKRDRFEVEEYLEYQGNKFAGYYDANCYLALSYNMDRMNLGYGFNDYAEGVSRIPIEKEIMLLSYNTDYLIPASELEQLSAILGSRSNSKVYYENLQSVYGHDTFLISNEMKQIDYRLRPFLESGAKEVERVVHQELH